MTTKSVIKDRIRTLFTLLTAAVGTQYDVAKEFLVALVDYTQPEEIEEVLDRLDEAGYHLVHAYRELLHVFSIASDVVDRTKDDGRLNAVIAQYEHHVERLSDFGDSTAKLVTNSVPEDLFPHTRQAYANVSDEPDMEPTV